MLKKIVAIVLSLFFSMAGFTEHTNIYAYETEGPLTSEAPAPKPEPPAPESPETEPEPPEPPAPEPPPVPEPPEPPPVSESEPEPEPEPEPFPEPEPAPPALEPEPPAPEPDEPPADEDESEVQEDANDLDEVEEDSPANDEENFEVKAANLRYLISLVTEAQQLVRERYTSESWNYFSSQLNFAISVLNHASSDSDLINTALRSLGTAISRLIEAGITPVAVRPVSLGEYRRLGSVEIGERVLINVDGIPTNFIVIHHGNPSADYVGFENTAILMSEFALITMRIMPNIWEIMDYRLSYVHSWLNSEFIASLDDEIRERIPEVRIPVTVDYYWDGAAGVPVDIVGQNGLLTKAFILSGTEAVREVETKLLPGQAYNGLGTLLSYFTRPGNGLYTNVAIAGFATRSIILDNSLGQFLRAIVHPTMNGPELSGIGAGTSIPARVRPAFALPNNLYVSPDGFVVLESPSGNGNMDIDLEGIYARLDQQLEVLNKMQTAMESKAETLENMSKILLSINVMHFLLLGLISLSLIITVCVAIWKGISYHLIQVWI